MYKYCYSFLNLYSLADVLPPIGREWDGEDGKLSDSLLPLSHVLVFEETSDSHAELCWYIDTRSIEDHRSCYMYMYMSMEAELEAVVIERCPAMYSLTCIASRTYSRQLELNGTGNCQMDLLVC